MNTFSTFAIFVVVLFAYNTPTQGETNFTVAEVVFKNGQKCVSNSNAGKYASLIKISENSYGILETSATGTVPVASFAINDFHTMIWNTVVLATNINTLQIKFPSMNDAQQLFDLVGRASLRWKMYSYDLTAVYEYDKGCIMQNGKISGFDTPISDSTNRYVIHTGGMKHSLGASFTLNPFILWTTYGFNYCVFDERSIVLTLLKPNDKTCTYYLVKFRRPDELFKWKRDHGKFLSSEIPEATVDPRVIPYFTMVYIRTD